MAGRIFFFYQFSLYRAENKDTKHIDYGTTSLHNILKKVFLWATGVSVPVFLEERKRKRFTSTMPLSGPENPLIHI
jgi:hypothetical protein